MRPVNIQREQIVFGYRAKYRWVSMVTQIPYSPVIEALVCACVMMYAMEFLNTFFYRGEWATTTFSTSALTMLKRRVCGSLSSKS
jgi:hypothetical protein